MAESEEDGFTGKARGDASVVSRRESSAHGEQREMQVLFNVPAHDDCDCAFRAWEFYFESAGPSMRDVARVIKLRLE